jgi:hypothetical protein
VKIGTLARSTAAFGLAFVALSVLSGFIYPQQPRVDSSPATTLQWVHDHRLALQIGMIFAFFAPAILVWFGGYLRTFLSRQGGLGEVLGPVAFGGAIAVAVADALAALPYTVMAFMEAQPAGISDPTVVRMLGDLNTVFFAATSAMTAVLLTAIGVAMIRGVLLHAWLGWLCVIVAIFNGLAVWIGVTFSSYHGKGWMVVGWGAYVGFLAVILILSVSMLRGSRVLTSSP